MLPVAPCRIVAAGGDIRLAAQPLPGSLPSPLPRRPGPGLRAGSRSQCRGLNPLGTAAARTNSVLAPLPVASAATTTSTSTTGAAAAAVTVTSGAKAAIAGWGQRLGTTGYVPPPPFLATRNAIGAQGFEAEVAKAATAAVVKAAEEEAVARPAVFSRRRLGGLTAALLLLQGLSPDPKPALGPRPSWPPVGVATAAAAAEAPAAAADPDGGSQPRDQSAAREEAFCYVAPEPLNGLPKASAVEGPRPPPGPPAPRHFRSLAAAVAACPPGGVVLVAEGRYTERLMLSRPLTLRAWPKGAAVEVVWETREPYQSTLEISAPPPPPPPLGRVGELGVPVALEVEVEVEGLTIRHSSKSVANNYGVYIRGGSPRLLNCDIRSTSGAGVGVEGASPQLVGCRIHDCARQGIAIFGATVLDLGQDPAVDPGLLYGITGGVVRGCDVYGNALDGLLVRSGASPDILDNLIHNNGGVGVNLQDCSGRYERNTVYDNARGSLSVSALFELDTGDLAGSNSLRGLLRRGP